MSMKYHNQNSFTGDSFGNGNFKIQKGVSNRNLDRNMSGPRLDKLAGQVPCLLEDDLDGEMDQDVWGPTPTDNSNSFHGAPHSSVPLSHIRQPSVSSLESAPLNSVAAFAFNSGNSSEVPSRSSFGASSSMASVHSPLVPSYSSEKIDDVSGTEVPLEEAEYYFGDIGRGEAERILKLEGRDVFLVRSREDSIAQSGPNYAPYCASYIVKGKILHTKLFCKDGDFYFGAEKRSFSKVPELISYYGVNELIVPGGSAKFTLEKAASK